MSTRNLTPIEQTHKFVIDFIASLRLHRALEEMNKLTEEERSTPENQLVIELLLKAVYLTNKDKTFEA